MLFLKRDYTCLGRRNCANKHDDLDAAPYLAVPKQQVGPGDIPGKIIES